MKKIKTNKATGCDRIPPRAVKESSDILCYPFSKLFNYILDCSKIPQQWKLGEISPVFKKDCCLTKTNFRPLTILPSLSKALKTLVHSRISPYFEDIFHEHVFAYRKYYGTDTALLCLTEQWSKQLESHNIIGIVSMNLSKAFDTLPHDLILAKLKSYGAEDNTANVDERSSSSILRKWFLSPGRGSNPQPSDDRLDDLTIELPRLRWWAKVQIRHICAT